MPIDIEIVDLTDYSGQNADTAETAISGAGFTVQKSWARHDTLAAGLVISQSVVPSGDGQAVALLISVGGYSDADRLAIMAYNAFFGGGGPDAKPINPKQLGL